MKNINEKLIKYMYENLEDFGKDCAIDGKFLDTYANHYSKEKCVDNRAEHDATNSCKTYYMKDGTTKKEWHYGFRAHIMCDAKYGLPIKYKLTPANNSEQTELDNLLKDLAANDSEKYKLEKMENLMGDTGYDNGKRNNKLKQEYDINPVFDIKHIWDKDEKYKEIDDKAIAYNEDGEVFYIVDIDWIVNTFLYNFYKDTFLYSTGVK